ncbi:MAG: hypothetical protein EBV28_10250 [Betaproteobacteria bacterium]|nr:hypothetical protein [Betaproteobacteria bacterium]
MPETARDYRHAIRLIETNLAVNFRVTNDGGIQRDTSKHFPMLGGRKVEQLRRDAEVGKALIKLYGQAVTSGSSAQGQAPLINPRQLAVVERFMAAYDQIYGGPADGGQVRSASQAPGLLSRTPSIGVASDLSAAALVDSNDLYRVVEGRLCSDLEAFNAHTLGGGNVIFRALYDRTQFLKPVSSEATVDYLDDVFAQTKRGFVAKARRQIEDTKDLWIAEHLVPGTDFEELEQNWQDMLPIRVRALEAGGSLSDIRAKLGPKTCAALSDYISDCHAEGLKVDHAMTPIRIWMGPQAQTVERAVQLNPNLLPDMDELQVLCQLVEQGMPLTDLQANALLKYMPPPSS